MATNYFSGGTALESIFIYLAAGTNPDYSTGYKVAGVDLSKYLYRASSNTGAVNYMVPCSANAAPIDIRTQYCTSGCNGACIGCTSCSGCTGCTSCSGCTGSCTATCSSSCITGNCNGCRVR